MGEKEWRCQLLGSTGQQGAAEQAVQHLGTGVRGGHLGEGSTAHTTPGDSVPPTGHLTAALLLTAGFPRGLRKQGQELQAREEEPGVKQSNMTLGESDWARVWLLNSFLYLP